MGLLVFLRNDPGFDTVEDHLVHGDPISQMDSLLEPQYAKDLQLHRGQVVEQVVEFVVAVCRLNSFVDGDDQSVGLLD